MINLSDSAKKCLDKYLQQVRTHLQGCKKVDADEVERNVIEHIESEFEAATATVSFEQLDTVLQRLGSPRQWVPEEEIPWWRKTILRLRTGPEDWRLAYLSFGLFVFGVLLLPIGVVLIAASFIAARAAVSVVEDATLLKAQKWLLYPSLITAYLGLLGAFLALPLLGLMPLASELEHKLKNDFRILDDMHYWLAACLVFAASLGLWWIIQAVVLLVRPNIPKVLFRPFALGFNRKWALVLTCVGFVVLVASLVALKWVCGRYFTL